MKKDPSARRNPLSEYLGGTAYTRLLIAIDSGHIRLASLWAVAVGIDDGNSPRWAWRGRYQLVQAEIVAPAPPRIRGLA